MDRCQCESWGFCSFFQQEMTYEPPNWQWCQNATPEERKKYKIAVEKKHKRRATGPWCYPDNLSIRFSTVSSLVDDIKKHLLPKLAKLEIKGVVGIPRSGMLPATLCALWLNVPMYSVAEDGSLHLMSNASGFGGLRMSNFKERQGAILLIDDTLSSGGSMKEALESIKTDEKIITCAVYANPKNIEKIDVYGIDLHHPYILDWCFFNTSYMEKSYLDFDGILSPDVPSNIANDESKYVEYMANVAPIQHRLPRLYKIKGIVTARLEKYRKVTEWWLDKHEIEYEELHMFPTERQQERDANHIEESSSFKSDIYKKSDAFIFVESHKLEAKKIHEKSGKVVICPDDERIWVKRDF